LEYKGILKNMEAPRLKKEISAHVEETKKEG
jgi:hypothetical protein